MLTTILNKKIYSILLIGISIILLSSCGLGTPGDSSNKTYEKIATISAPTDPRIVFHEDKVIVRWSPVKGANHYHVYYSKNRDVYNNIAQSTVKSVQNLKSAEATLESLETNKIYFFTIVAIDENKKPVLSSEYKFITRLVKKSDSIPAPTNFKANVNNEDILLVWDQSERVINYVVYWSTEDPGVNPLFANQITNIAQLSYNFKNAVAGKTYHFRIKAVTLQNSSPLSDVVSAEVKEIIKSPHTPQRFSAQVGDGLVALHWDSVVNAGEYIIYLAEEPGVNADNVTSLKGGQVYAGIRGISTNRLGLENDTTYYFSIAAKNEKGTSLISNQVAATPQSFRPDVPNKISATSYNRAIKVQWEAAEKASSYNVYSFDTSIENRAAATVVSSSEQTEFFHDELDSEISHFYFVTAINEEGESAPSAIVAATPNILPLPPLPPTDIRFLINQDTIDITWEENSAADEFVLYFASSEFTTTDDALTLPSGTQQRFIRGNQFTQNGLLPGTEYYFALSAVNQGGEGELSSLIYVITPQVEEQDSIAPTINSESNNSLSKPAAVNQIISFQLSEAVNPESVNKSTIKLVSSNNEPLDYEVRLNGLNVEIIPETPLSYDSSYTITVQDLTDYSNNKMPDSFEIQVDTEPAAIPVITLIGPETMQLFVGQVYNEPGASAEDFNGLDISNNIVISGEVDTTETGSYSISYNATDESGLVADEQTRIVNVVANNPPSIQLIGPSQISIVQGTDYQDLGATASDNEDGNITSNLRINNPVDSNVTGNYLITYDVNDSLGIAALQVTRQVTVYNTQPIISLNGADIQNISQHDTYNDAGATAFDEEDKDIAVENINVSGVVDTSKPGVYKLFYNVVDSHGLAADQVSRTVNVINEAKPIIQLQGNNPLIVFLGQDFVDPGATATDEEDDDLTSQIQIAGEVNTNLVGNYFITYDVSDSGGANAETVVRTVEVIENEKPVISIIGQNPIRSILGNTYVDAGATASDKEDGDLTINIIVDNPVDSNQIGFYIVTYSVTDSLGNSADPVTRNVEVYNTAPEIILNGDNPFNLIQGQSYIEPGATANDAEEGSLPADNIAISGSINVNIPGAYEIYYDVTDSFGLSAQTVTRVVNISNPNQPIIELLGDNPVTVVQGTEYVDAGATASDAEDGNISDEIITVNNVNSSELNSYQVTYNVTDSGGLAAIEVIRTVNVVANNKPVISLNGANPLRHVQGQEFTDPGASAFDDHDDDTTISDLIQVSGTVNSTSIGFYELTYTVTDSHGLAADPVIRTVEVYNTAPVITLTGDNPLNLVQYENYIEPGATATDAEDDNNSLQIQISGTVNTSIPGSYFINYDVSDSQGLPATQRVRTVIVDNPNPPTITLNGSSTIELVEGSSYEELGATASDPEDGDIDSDQIIIESNVNTSIVDTYQVSYNVNDSGGRAAIEVIRTVNVIANNRPVITPLGDTVVNVVLGDAYIDAGATATDVEDDDNTLNIITGGLPIDTNTLGTYKVTYDVTDSGGVAATQVTRTVVVNDPAGWAIKLVSKNPTGVPSNGRSFYSSVSDNGRYVAFESNASDLVSDDTNGLWDIFLYDNQTDSTTLISRNTLGLPANGDSRIPSMSADGIFIVYTSAATDLVGTDTNGANDVFLYEIATSITTRVSIDSDQIQAEGDSFLFSNAISNNGRYVVFDSQASNLVAGDTNALKDIFRHDTQTGETIRINVSSSGVEANGFSGATFTDMSADGNKVSFVSIADNLAPNDTNAQYDVFVRDISAGTTTRVSVGNGGIEGNNTSCCSSISNDGRYSVFNSTATNFFTGDSNNNYDVFLRDTVSNTTTLISVSSSGVQGDGLNSSPFISGDGRFISYPSNALNLVANGAVLNPNAAFLPYLHDTLTGDTTLILEPVAGSVSVAGPSGSGVIAINNDGNAMVMYSDEYNLVPSDNNAELDVFLALRDTDNDGLGDTDELVLGTQPFIPDTDGDGVSDGDEISQGSDPLDSFNLPNNSAPVITLNGSATVTIVEGLNYTDAGATATDSEDDDIVITANIQNNSTVVNTAVPGTYIVAYDVWDSGNLRATQITRIVTVAPNNTPTLSLDGDSVVNVVVGETYIDAGASATDVEDDDATLTSNIVVNGLPSDTSTPATYIVTYDVTDSSGFAATQITRTVVVNNPAGWAHKLVSKNSVGNPANQWSIEGAISADGRYVVFSSDATDIVVPDTNGFTDIFLQDVQTGTTIKINNGLSGAEANGLSDTVDISADGLFVVFESEASNLIANDINGVKDVFVYDVTTTAITRVNQSTTGTAANQGAWSGSTSISDNGQYIVFNSHATNLVANDTNGMQDVFRHDRSTGETIRISVSTAGVEGNETTYVQDISPDGQQVVFWSRASNLVAADTNDVADVFLKDLQTGEVTLISVDSNEQQAVGPDLNLSYRGAISDDGQFVVFTSTATNLVPNDTNGGPNAYDGADVFVRDLIAGTTTLISANLSGVVESSGSSSVNNIFSGNGRFAPFFTNAQNLTTDTTNPNNFYIAYLRDLSLSQTELVSKPRPAYINSGHAQPRAISDDGSVLLYGSNDPTIVANDANGTWDLFLALRDTDNDGLGDVDEALLGTQVFIPDSDGDGFVDGDEVIQGSNPSLSSSIPENTQPVITLLGSSTVNITQGLTYTDAGATAFDAEDSDITASIRSNINIPTIAGPSLVHTDTPGTYVVTYDVWDSGNLRAAQVTRTVNVVANNAPVISLIGDPVINIVLGDTYTDIDARAAVIATDFEDDDATLTSNIVVGGLPIDTSILGRHTVTYDVTDSNGGIATQVTQTVVVNDKAGWAFKLISKKPSGDPGNGYSTNGVVSDDGRYVVFQSTSTDLVTDDSNGFQDIFLYDTQADTTSLISRNSIGEPANAASFLPWISADGGFVGYTSTATDLVLDDTNAQLDAFLYDITLNETTRISVDSSGIESDGGSFTFKAMSNDGRYLVFESAATNLVVGDGNDIADIFRHDILTGETVRVSINSFGEEANGASQYAFDLSSDGNLVLFYSEATNLISTDTNNCPDLFVRNVIAETTSRVSLGTGGLEPTGTQCGSISGDFSADGRYLAFESGADNLFPDDNDNSSDIFLRDTFTNTTTLISINAAGDQGDAIDSYPIVSGDGQYVAIYSNSSNLTMDALSINPNLKSNIFLYDSVEDDISLLIKPLSGTISTVSNISFVSNINFDGSEILFATDDYTLAANDTNGLLDVFMAKRDTDNDGISDVDEIALGTHPLLPDSDNDGFSDGVEVSQASDPLDPLNFPVNTAPVITLNGSDSITITVAQPYTDEGASATDAEDNDAELTANILNNASIVDTATPGTYIITYDVWDSGNLRANQLTRTVNVTP